MVHAVRRVRVVVDGVEWLGVHHGVGFRFEASDGRVIESHDGILDPPYPIDAYRLGEYAASIGADVIALENIIFASDDTRAFERCLPVLMERGLIVADYRPKGGGLARYTVKG
jgi:hypothetical protein